MSSVHFSHLVLAEFLVHLLFLAHFSHLVSAVHFEHLLFLAHFSHFCSSVHFEHFCFFSHLESSVPLAHLAGAASSWATAVGAVKAVKAKIAAASREAWKSRETKRCDIIFISR